MSYDLVKSLSLNIINIRLLQMDESQTSLGCLTQMLDFCFHYLDGHRSDMVRSNFRQSDVGSQAKAGELYLPEYIRAKQGTAHGFEGYSLGVKFNDNAKKEEFLSLLEQKADELFGDRLPILHQGKAPDRLHRYMPLSFFIRKDDNDFVQVKFVAAYNASDMDALKNVQAVYEKQLKW